MPKKGKVMEYLDENGQKRHRFTINRYSSKIPGLRVTKEREGIKTREEAERLYGKLKEEAKAEPAVKETKGCSWSNVIQRFGYAYEMGVGFDPPVSKATAIDTQRGLELHTRDWWHLAAADVTKPMVQTLMRQLEAQGLSKSRRRSIKGYIGAAWLWGKDNGLIQGVHHNPIEGVKIGRSAKKGEEKPPEVLNRAKKNSPPVAQTSFSAKVSTKGEFTRFTEESPTGICHKSTHGKPVTYQASDSLKITRLIKPSQTQHRFLTGSLQDRGRKEAFRLGRWWDKAPLLYPAHLDRV